jgi:hypothetical protein
LNEGGSPFPDIRRFDFQQRREHKHPQSKAGALTFVADRFLSLALSCVMASSKEKSKCKYCRRSVARTFSVECAECANFALCGDCFSAGVEIGTHKNDHKYKVADCLEFPLFAKDWTVSEELALLEGKFSLPNSLLMEMVL